MNRRTTLTRIAAGAIGGVLLVGAAGAALADDLDNDEITVNVEIAPLPPVGALTMSVAGDSVTLTEVDSGETTVRQFDGTLPTVTISDDRAEVPDQVSWYVLGQVSAFVAPGVPDIDAGHLGWSPKLLTEDSEENVLAGDEVLTVLDAPPNNVGLEGRELLALALDSGQARQTGVWTATADLTLKTPATVAPGNYGATLTLSLWEDGY